jgi:hypothetical protein
MGFGRCTLLENLPQTDKLWEALPLHSSALRQSQLRGRLCRFFLSHGDSHGTLRLPSSYYGSDLHIPRLVLCVPVVKPGSAGSSWSTSAAASDDHDGQPETEKAVLPASLRPMPRASRPTAEDEVLRLLDDTENGGGRAYPPRAGAHLGPTLRTATRRHVFISPDRLHTYLVTRPRPGGCPSCRRRSHPRRRPAGLTPPCDYLHAPCEDDDLARRHRPHRDRSLAHLLRPRPRPGPRPSATSPSASSSKADPSASPPDRVLVLGSARSRRP